MNRCGYFYETLNFENGSGWVLVYPILYQLRFLLIVFLSLNLKHLVIQIELFMFMTIAICAVLGIAKPFKILPQNYDMLRSEAFVIAVMDLFLVVSDPTLTGWI